LVKETARAGQGSYEIVHNNDQVVENVISLLKASITPSLVGFKVDYPKGLVDCIAPDPESISQIAFNKAFTMFVFFNDSFTKDRKAEIKLSYNSNKEPGKKIS